MLRLARALREPAQQRAARPLSEFARRASYLKHRFRGKGQYAFARTEAQRFLDAEVPKTSINAWMDNSSNAIALSQLSRFFEIQPDATLSSLLLNTLVRTAEDNTVDAASRLEAVLALTSMRPEENYERAFATVEDVLKHSAATGPSPTPHLWGILDLSAKVLQRCGKRVPTALTNSLCQAVMLQLRSTDSQQFTQLQSSLLRIYSWLVRAEREEARHILFVLVTHTGEFRPFDFSTLLQSCWRHHLLHPLPLELIEKLARTGLQYCTTANGRDVASTVSTIARMLNSLEPGKNGVSVKERAELQNRFSALLEDYQPRVLRLMDPTDRLYWKSSDDITSIVFAFEMGGHLRYRGVFAAYGAYVLREVQHFEPTQLAMSTGILRRAHLLTADLAGKLADRIEVVLGELRLPELGHIAATFAALPNPPSWMAEARAVALRLPSNEASGLTLLNLAIAFPGEESFASRVRYERLTASQLVDSLPLVLGSKTFEAPVVNALMARLADPTERLSPDGVRILLASNRPAVVKGVSDYLARRFAEPEWDLDTLYCLPLVASSGQFGAAARDPVKALAIAKTASIAPEQFVSLAELLTALFGDSDSSIVSFVRTGGHDLLSADRVLARTAARYLAVVRALPSLHPAERWLSEFTEKLGPRLRLLKPTELESLLVSLHAIYTDVSRTPAVQMALSEIVENVYPMLAQPDAQTARVTVLLVYLQRGMNLPLLTAQSPMLVKVQQCVADYPKDVRDAVAAMPVPPSAQPTEKKLGRFVLKHVSRETALQDGDDANIGEADLQQLDLTMDTDPFAMPANPPHAEDRQASLSDPTRTAVAPPSVEEVPVVPAQPVQPLAAHTAAEPEPAQESQHEDPAPRQTSYYTKFFKSSVGQLFKGKTADVEETATHGDDAAPRQRGEELLQPRRTRLHPTAAAAAQAPAADPVPSSFFGGWGSPPTLPGTPPISAPPPPPTPQPQAPAAVAPPASTTASWASGPGQYDIPTTTQNTALFSSLFESSSAPTAALPSQEPVAPVAAFSALFGAPAASVPPPPPPSSAGATEAPAVSRVAPPQASTPFSSVATPATARASSVMSPAASGTASKRPVITRRGVMGRPVPVGIQQQQQHQQPAPAAASGSLAMDKDISSIYEDSTRAAETPPGAAPGEAEIVLDAQQGTPAAGMATFMSRVGLRKISGYNMNGADGESSAPTPTAPTPAAPAAPAPAAAQEAGTGPVERAPAPPGRPLAWQEAARQVSHVSRYAKTKVKTRGQQSLSEWLSAPAKKLSDSVGEGAAAPPAPAVRGARGRKGGRGSHAAPASEAADSATESPAPEKKTRGRKAAGAPAATTRKGKKAAKGAAKAPAKAPAKAKAAAKPKPKRAAPAKAKPKPKKSPAARKTPAKSAASKKPAKKSAQKKK